MKSFFSKGALLGMMLVSAGLLFSACAQNTGGNGDSGNSNTGGDGSTTTGEQHSVNPDLASVADGYFRINWLGSLSTYDVYVWNDSGVSGWDSTETAKNTVWTSTCIPLATSNGDYKCADIKLAANPTQLKFIVRSAPSDDGKLTGDMVFDFPAKYKEIFLKDGKAIYIDKNLSKVASGLAGAIITSSTTITLTASGTADFTASNIKVTGGSTDIPVTAVSENIVTVSGDLKTYGTVTVTFTDVAGTPDIRIATPSDTLLDEWYAVDDSIISSFGYNVSTGTFVTWAPFATDAKVVLFADVAAVNSSTSAAVIDMVKQSNGTWKAAGVSSAVGSNKYYKYRFTNNGTVYDVCDIWAKVASKNSVATEIVDINDASAQPASWETSYTNPFGSTGSQVKSYTDAVIYEMNITDWSQAFRDTVKTDTPGTFNEITAALDASAGKFAAHLKDIGVTHVQILPMFEYDLVQKYTADKKKEDTATDTGYNWGYNPYNWNTPESRYVTEMTDGTDAVKQMRAMIKAFHDNGIAVNMDVVYNHTAGTGAGSIYDMTVPQYFYRTSNGIYSNGSGCGNETATNHKMVKSYVIDSLKHWMKDYHINGFRFDLMGLHETETMSEIYKELSSIDKNVMVYGEPWTGGTSSVVNGTTKSTIDNCADATYSANGVACFNDDYRNAVKGAEFGGFDVGQVQTANSDNKIVAGLMGSTGSNGFTSVLGRSINYVECHDNYTLFDKLNISLDSGCKTAKNPSLLYTPIADFAGSRISDMYKIKTEDKLAAAYVFLAQGTPFINGGQEFLRTKLGDPDSYAADTKDGKFWSNIDEVNAIDLTFKSTYSDVYNTYKGLIALRKANPAAFGGNTNAAASTPATGVTKYTTGDFLVYFNATTAAYTIDTTGYTTVVDVTSGTPTTSTALPAEVAAKSFVILKK